MPIRNSTPKWNRRRTAAFLACLMSVCVLIFQAGCAPRPYSKTGPAAIDRFRPLTHDELIAKAKRQGKVRIIIRLKTPYAPEGDLKNKKAIIAQRESIQRLQNQLLKELAPYKVTSVKRYKFIPYISMEVNTKALERLFKNPDVVSIEEDQLVPPLLDDSTELIGAQTCWNLSYRGDGQTIVILDTGIDKNHDFLRNKVVDEVCFSSSVSSSSATTLCPNGNEEQYGPGAGITCALNIDGCDHGTHVGGIAAGWGGVAPYAFLISIQVFSRIDSATECESHDLSTPCTLSYTSDQLEALEWVYEHTWNTVGIPMTPPIYQIAAVNMSLGGGQNSSPCDSSSLKAAIDNLRSVGVATIIASGNDGYTDAIAHPACISTAVSVGSTCKQDEISSFSNHADFLSLWAPGENISSSVPDGSFSSMSGTSMAAPHVAGAWAILKSCKPDASVQEILQKLQSTGKSITDSTTRRIQIDQATWGLCRFYTPPPPTSCVTQNDCGPGQWCLSGVCRPPPFSHGCRGDRHCADGACMAARNVGTQVDIIGHCDDMDPNKLHPDQLPPGASCWCVEY